VKIFNDEVSGCRLETFDCSKILYWKQLKLSKTPLLGNPLDCFVRIILVH